MWVKKIQMRTQMRTPKTEGYRPQQSLFSSVLSLPILHHLLHRPFLPGEAHQVEPPEGVSGHVEKQFFKEQWNRDGTNTQLPPL
ncbi:hypothetical protein J4Q44_G00023080 [Coregonus suidteri]|uniref:Uncharacterized protein n=1 Tax=Coregonus suidteri TaxID=861788 RepID=A0AAN8MH41_9TELE